jgi:hypothetical protein
VSTLVTRRSLVELRQLERAVRSLSRSSDFYFTSAKWTTVFHKRSNEKASRREVYDLAAQAVVPEGTFLLSNYVWELHVILDPAKDPMTDQRSPLKKGIHLERVSMVVAADRILSAFPDKEQTLFDPSSLGPLVRVEWTREQLLGFLEVDDPKTDTGKRRVPLLRVGERLDQAYVPNHGHYRWDSKLYDWRPEWEVRLEELEAERGALHQ